jgi:V/A-type H+/Na+-transporting ATPase subunit E
LLVKTLDQGQDKIEKICQILREETLIPAQDEAREIIEKAHQQARRIIEKARSEAETLEQEAHHRVEQERRVFESSLAQAGKQGLEVVRQAIEEKVLRDNLRQKVVESTANPQAISALVDAIVDALKRDGMATDLTALIPASVDPREVNQLLAKETLSALGSGGVELGGFAGGVQIILQKQKVTIDISDQALLELLGRFLRKDLRDLLFRECS